MTLSCSLFCHIGRLTKGVYPVKRFRAKEQAYLNQEEAKTFKVWHPQVKFNNQWCFLPDKNTRSGLVEATDEAEAIELAIKAMRELEATK